MRNPLLFRRVTGQSPPLSSVPCAVSFTVDQAPGTSLDLSWALWGIHKITQAGSLPLRLSRVYGMRQPAGGVLQQAATLSPPEPWLPDLLVDSDGQAANAPCPWEE